ncbi:MAG: hypothetical protein HQL64_15715 [Magnetococcales bacterium]|nr:hypothetical protein [Magnetococcales bacterium]
MEPEMALWNAVLAQAANDAKMLLKRVRKDPSLWSNALFCSEVRHLKRYFHCGSMTPGGFGFVCDLMDVDAKRAARQIEEQYLRHLKCPNCMVNPPAK